MANISFRDQVGAIGALAVRKASLANPVRSALATRGWMNSVSRGTGMLSGEFPDGITTIEGAPVSAEVRVLVRGEFGEAFDGAVVGSTVSASDGTWTVEGLDPDLKFDVVVRKEGYNDVMVTNVSPWNPLRLTETEVTAYVAQAFNYVIPVIGGHGTLTVAVSGTLPSGISFSAGTLSGTWPTGATGEYPIVVTVTDGNGDSASKTLTIVLSIHPLVLPLSEIPSVFIGQAFSYSFSASGGEGPYTYAVTAGSLPGGLTLNGSSGEISGTPASGGPYSFSVTATDVRSASAVRAYSGHINSDPYYSNVVLLAPFNGVAENVITNANFTVTGGAGITGGGKFADCATTANSGRFEITDANLALGTGPCTIEFWVNPSNGGAGNYYGRVLQTGDNSALGGIFIVRCENANPLTLLVQIGTGGGYETIIVGSTPVPNNVWTHIALTRDASDMWRLFVGGALETTSNVNARSLGPTTLRLGQNNSGAEQFNGAYDDLRITKGVCRYTNTFTPPSAPFD